MDPAPAGGFLVDLDQNSAQELLHHRETCAGPGPHIQGIRRYDLNGFDGLGVGSHRQGLEGGADERDEIGLGRMYAVPPKEIRPRTGFRLAGAVGASAAIQVVPMVIDDAFGGGF